MRIFPFGEPPARLEIFRKVLCLLQRSKNHLVNLPLIGSLGLRERLLLLWLAVFEKLILCRSCAFLFRLGKVRIVDLHIGLQRPP